MRLLTLGILEHSPLLTQFFPLLIKPAIKNAHIHGRVVRDCQRIYMYLAHYLLHRRLDIFCSRA